MIRPCTCDSPQQDTRYGKGMRVKNPTRKTNGADVPGARCTVCSRVEKE